ncbi:MAG: WhiB family transcriptional regulator [Blastococcus sp.]
MTRVPYPELTGAEPCKSGDPERWFPSAPHRGGPVAAECRPCPVREQCFAWAVTHAVEGVWGGSTETMRRHYQKRHDIIPERIPTGPNLVPANVLKLLDRGVPGVEVARRYGVPVEVVQGMAANRRRPA